jgi:hypothetical protein
MKKVIIFLVGVLLCCSNPTAPKTAVIAWRVVKIYYDPQISPPFDDRIVSKDTSRVLYRDSTDSMSFKQFGTWHSIPAWYGSEIGIPTGDTIRIFSNGINDTLRSYFTCNGLLYFAGNGADTLIVTKDTTWILN